MERPNQWRALIATSVVTLLALGACTDPDQPDPETPSPGMLLSNTKAPAAGFHGTANFHLTQNTIQVDAQFGNAPAIHTFALDSGAPMTIAPRLAKNLGLETLASVGLKGPKGGHRSVPVTLIPEMTVAGLAFHDVGAVVDWVEPPSALACLSKDGLMGASLLQAAIWQIDFQAAQVTVTDSLTGLPGLDRAMRIPFKRSDAAGSPRIDVGVSDSSHVSLLIDLGFNGSLAIPASLFEQSGNRLTSDAPSEDGQASSTVFGDTASVVRIGRLRELRLGELRLEDFPVVTGGAVSDFHIGIEFLRHFRVTLDWQKNDLYLERRDPESALYHDYSTYGFKPKLQDGELVVGALWRASAATGAGLKLGDRIVEIDGRPTESPDFGTLCGILDSLGLFGSGDEPIVVTVRRDRQLEKVTVPKTPLLAARKGAAVPSIQ
jgi:hypothetical protein